MEYRCITVPEAGIARGETVECEAYDLVGGQLVKADNKLPVFGATLVNPGFALAVEVNGTWIVQWEDC